jgi:transcriptional regulator with XRE-family HTH domain
MVSVPRRTSPDPLAAAIGRRVRALREAQGYNLEKLAFEGGLSSKGHLSDLEHGRLIPTVGTLQTLATHLGVELLDLVTFPDTSVRHRLVARSATLPVPLLQRWSDEAEHVPAVLTAPTKAPKRAPVVIVHTDRPPRGAIPLVELHEAANLGVHGPVTSGRWIKGDVRTRGLPGAFAAPVRGTAMLPRVEDGAICLFRRPGPGNRSGRIFLVWHRRLGPEAVTAADLLKLVDKDPVVDGALLLRALNPAVAPVRVDPVRDDVRVVAEFVTVLDIPPSAAAASPRR